MRRALAVLAATIGVLLAPAAAQAQPTATQLMRAVTVKNMDRHLLALQRIALANGGNRAAGTPGYQASVDYVAGQLRRWGYRVQIQPFSYVESVLLAPPVVERVGSGPLTSAMIPNSAAGD